MDFRIHLLVIKKLGFSEEIKGLFTYFSPPFKADEDTAQGGTDRTPRNTRHLHLLWLHTNLWRLRAALLGCEVSY